MRLDGLDSCVIGLNKSMKPVYSQTKLINHFSKEMSIDQAFIWVDYNIRSLESSDAFFILYDWQ